MHVKLPVDAFCLCFLFKFQCFHPTTPVNAANALNLNKTWRGSEDDFELSHQHLPLQLAGVSVKVRQTGGARTLNNLTVWDVYAYTHKRQ